MADEWREMVTAPLDGTDVLLRGTSPFGDWELETWYMNDTWYGLSDKHVPTGWQPVN